MIKTTNWGEIAADLEAVREPAPLLLSEVRHALLVATPGPWLPFGSNDPTKMIPITTTDTKPLAYVGVQGRPNDANAILIANAVTWLAQMADQLGVLRAKLGVNADDPFDDVLKSLDELLDLEKAQQPAVEVGHG